MLRSCVLIPLLFLAFSSPLAPVVTQRPAVLPATVFALRDVRVCEPGGKTIDKANVVLRDGVIDAVGADVKIPADATIIEGKGLTVYPGFVDAFSTWGFDAEAKRSEVGPPEEKDLGSEALAATRSDFRKGVTPEFLVSRVLKVDEQVDAWRRVGVTSHLVAAEGGLFTGQSVLVSLSGAVPRDSILRSPVFLHAAFRSGGGNEYPRALMGVVAHARQTLLDAGHHQEVWDAFEKAGRAGRRPPFDPSLAALQPALQQKQAVVFEAGVTVHPTAGPALEKMTVTLKDGKIKSVAKGYAAPKARADLGIVDGRGLHLYPGMIDAATVIGLTELGSAKETNDYAESGEFQPDLRASTAINPDSELIPVTRANGVTTVLTRPTGSIIAGQSALINLFGWTPKEMTLLDPLALHIDFPAPFPAFLSDPNGPRVGRAIAKKQRDERVRRLKELFRQALVHETATKENPQTPGNPRLEALIPYAKGEKPVIIQAQRKEEILEALKLADELKIKVILSGALDAWKVTEELKKRDVAVILGPLMALPTERYDPYDAPYACAAKLYEAGVKFCIRSAGASNTRNLPYEAAMGASYGLPPSEALKAVTLYPAQILGVEKQLGSIEVGKRANMVLTNGDVLQASTQVLGVFIEGRALQPTSKHSRLYERYQERLREVKEGKGTLGTK